MTRADHLVLDARPLAADRRSRPGGRSPSRRRRRARRTAGRRLGAVAPPRVSASAHRLERRRRQPAAHRYAVPEPAGAGSPSRRGARPRLGPGASRAARAWLRPAARRRRAGGAAGAAGSGSAPRRRRPTSDCSHRRLQRSATLLASAPSHWRRIAACQIRAAGACPDQARPARTPIAALLISMAGNSSPRPGARAVPAERRIRPFNARCERREPASFPDRPLSSALTSEGGRRTQPTNL